MKYLLVLLILVGSSQTFAQKSGGSPSSGKGSQSSRSNAVVDDPIKKADNRYQDRWTLADWFDTQHKVRLMDQWLAGNSSSNKFEFYLDANSGVLSRTNKLTTNIVPYRQNIYSIAAYATIVGLEGQFYTGDDKNNGWDALFHFRILGRSAQGTNITLHYGLRNRTEDIEGAHYEYQNQFASASINVHIIKAFGIGSNYRRYLLNTDKFPNVSGERVEGLVFIDYSFLRIYGEYFSEPMTYVTASNTLNYSSVGYILGATLFF